MRLTKITVHRYKSFITEQTLDVESGVTRIVGKNESGKSALLESMAKTKYFDTDNKEFKFDKTLDYPRSLLSKVSGENPEAVTCEYLLSAEDIAKIEEELGKGILKSESFSKISKYDNTATIIGANTDLKKFIDFICEKFELNQDDVATIKKCKDFDELIKICSISDTLSEAKTLLDKIQNKNQNISSEWGNPLDKYAYFSFISPNIPKFWYFSEYYSMPCRFNINSFANGNTDKSLTDEEYSTAKALFELSGLKAEELQDENNFEAFKAQLESTSNSITDELFNYWTTNENLEIRFEVEHTSTGRFLNIRVYNSKHRVTLPLRNRSKGFVWLFSFLVWFSKIQGNKNERYILLLDEPGLSLHAAAQGDLLRFIDEALAPNYQVLYTTHSPFMIDSLKLNEIRTVYDTQDKNIGSIVSDALEEKDSTTLFPLQAALGYNIAQNLYISEKNLLVEGISDLAYLNYFSELLESKGKVGLKDGITIVPVGGADKIATFISLLRGNELNIVCLLDTFTDQSAKARLDKMIVQNIIKDKKIVFYHSILNRQFADIEDMFSVAEYLSLFNGAFSKQVAIDEIDSDQPIMGQLKRLNNKKEFNHYAPARYLLQSETQPWFCDGTLSNFEALFKTINKLL